MVMQAPAGDTNCYDIHAAKARFQNSDRPVVITCWRPTPEELVKINLGEPVWLVVWGETMPPVAVTGDDPFGGTETDTTNTTDRTDQS